MKKLFQFILLLSFFISCEKEPSPPNRLVIITRAADSITISSVVSGGIISTRGTMKITQKGLCWSVSPSPTLKNSKVFCGSGSGNFTSKIIGLQPNTKYNIRAFATNSVDTAYGDNINIKTSAATKPTVTTVSVSNITPTSAKSGGKIISDGGFPILQKGICYSTTPTYLFSNIYTTTTNDINGTANYSSSMTSLTPYTTYFVRAYATNSAGISYGDTISFRPSIGVPTLTSPSIGFNYFSALNPPLYFNWNSVIGADSYEIQLCNSKAFSANITTTLPSCSSNFIGTSGYIYSEKPTTFSYCIAATIGNSKGTWYWRVRAKYGVYNGEWSDLWNIIIM